MKIKLAIQSAAIALLVTTINWQLSTAHAQGSLTPPGAPALTMKSLDQIEPRIPVDAFHTPGDANSAYAISNSGSYYFTTNLVPAAGKGYVIMIKANNVSIDLAGYSLLGQGTASFGIEVPNFQTNIIVRNGMVSRFNSYGIDCANVYVGSFDHLIFSQNNFVGLASGRRSTVQDCVAYNNNLDGFYVFAYTTVKNCSATENGATGIHLLEFGSRIENNNLIHNGIGLKVDSSGNLILHNSTTGNITNNYTIAAGNTVGPIVNAVNIATNFNPHANYDF